MKIKFLSTLSIIAAAFIFCSCSNQNNNYDANSFVGTWNSSQAVKITLSSDGTWQVSDCNFGKWFLHDNNIVWTYSDNPGMQDVNPIIKFDPDKFVIKEMSGINTIFKRIKY